MSSITGKSAVVTGSSSGIGRAIALALGRAGAAVTVNYRQDDDKDKAQKVAHEIGRSGGRGYIVRADVTDRADLDRLLKEAQRFGEGLDIAVAAAGGSAAFKPLAETTDAEWDKSTTLNQRSVFFFLKGAAEMLRDDGRIIVISSSMASDSYAGTSVYAGAKAALEAYVRTLAIEVGPRRITVNSVAPGLTDTAAMRAVVPADRLAIVVKNTPLGRLGRPEDVADVVSFLASPAGGWITAQVIRANGGIVT